MAQMLCETAGFTPSHRGQRIDITEAVAEQEDVSLLLRFPQGLPPFHLLNRHGLRLEDLLIVGKSQQLRDISEAAHFAWRELIGRAGWIAFRLPRPHCVGD